MQIPCKNVSPHIMHLLIVVFSSLLASSFAVSVSPDDKKWLINTLLSFRQDLRHDPAPTYMPLPRRAPGPVPIPTPDNFDFQPPSFGLRPTQSDVHNNKRNSFLRHSSFGLLCCNHPPTRPPRRKRPNSPPSSSDWRRLAQLLDAFEQSIDSHSPQEEERPEDLDDSSDSYFDEEDNPREPEVQRRGVTEDKKSTAGL